MILDFILGVLLLIAIYRGWRSGAVVMLLSIVVLVLAVILGVVAGPTVGGMLRAGPDHAHTAIGFIVVFLVVLIVGGFAKRTLKPRLGLLRGIDGLIGSGLALLRSTFILSVVLLLFGFIGFPPQTWRDTSRLYGPVVRFSSSAVHMLRDILPTELDQRQLEV